MFRSLISLFRGKSEERQPLLPNRLINEDSPPLIQDTELHEVESSTHEAELQEVETLTHEDTLFRFTEKNSSNAITPQPVSDYEIDLETGGTIAVTAARPYEAVDTSEITDESIPAQPLLSTTTILSFVDDGATDTNNELIHEQRSSTTDNSINTNESPATNEGNVDPDEITYFRLLEMADSEERISSNELIKKLTCYLAIGCACASGFIFGLAQADSTSKSDEPEFNIYTQANMDLAALGLFSASVTFSTISCLLSCFAPISERDYQNTHALNVYLQNNPSTAPDNDGSGSDIEDAGYDLGLRMFNPSQRV